MSIISRRYTKIIFKNFNKIIYHKNNLLIRPLKIEDIKENYIKSLQDKTINKYLVSKKKKELTQNHIKQYVSKNQISANDILFGIFFKKKHIGNSRLIKIKKNFFLGIIIFDKPNQNKGFGSKAINIVSDFAFKYLNANFVKAVIDSRNFQSIKAFKKSDFTIKFNTNTKISNKCLAIKSKNNLLK